MSYTSCYKILGMTCQNCVKAVSQRILEFQAVASADVTLPDSVTVQWHQPPTSQSLAELRQSLADLGYSLLEESEPENSESTNDSKKNNSGQPSFPKLNVFQPALMSEEKSPGSESSNLAKMPDMAESELVTIGLGNPEKSTAENQESWELSISGMHCASCVSRVESALKSTPGVFSATVNLATEQASVRVDPERTRLDQLRTNIRNAGYDMVKREAGLSIQDEADALRRERRIRVGQWRRTLVIGLIAGTPLVLMVHRTGHGPTSEHNYSLTSRVLLVLLSSSITAIVGLPYYRSAIGLLRKKAMNMDSLVALGATVALLYGTWMTLFQSKPDPHFLADGVIILVMVTFGKFLEVRSRKSAADALESLMDLAPRRVTAVRESGREIEIDQADLRIGMRFRVKPGESIATDGVIVEGSGLIDESMLTGEALPVEKSRGKQVIGGTRCINGSLLVKAQKVGQETVLQNIIQSVKEAQASKASVQKIVDKVASVFVPTVVLISFLTFLYWGLIRNDLTGGVFASASVLLISCPCALGLATPMAVAVSSARAARMGLIIKDAGVFERCNRLKICLFDKTGTLTTGLLKVRKVWTFGGMSREELLKYAAAVESRSEHPLAKAIVESNLAELTDVRVSGFQNERGCGIRAFVDDSPVLLGSMNWVLSQNCQIPEFEDSLRNEWEVSSMTLVAVCINHQLVGMIGLGDELRDSSAKTVQKLTAMGLKTGIVSGDRKPAVNSIASSLKILPELRFGEVLPEEKSDLIRNLRNSETQIAMVGDGLNDAPALASADVSMALSTGTDVAKNSADIVIVGSDLGLVCTAITLSQKTMSTIYQNLFWAFAYNVIAIPLAASGFFAEYGPLIASVAMGLSSITVVLRSTMLAVTNLNRT